MHSRLLQGKSGKEEDGAEYHTMLEFGASHF